MKKKAILLSAAMVTMAGFQLSAQNWGNIPGNPPTFTTDNVGIGFGGPVTDAKTHIWGDIWGSSNGYPCGFGVDYPLPKPELRIDDNRVGSETSEKGIPDNHNIVEVMVNQYLCSPFAMATSRMAFFVNGGVGGNFVGINKSTASSTLDVGGDIHSDHNATIDNTLAVRGDLIDMTDAGDNWRTINANSNSAALVMNAKSGSYNGASIELYGPSYPSAGSDIRAGAIHYCSYGASNSGHQFINYDGTTWHARMNIDNDGKVSIGEGIISSANTPNDYLLYVQKGILTEKLKVQISTDPWSDFVFNNDYNLLPLSKVESFVKTNKHLPEVPSAAEVAKDGIDVSNMDAKLLQKIEELTLYAIQQQKEIDELKKLINK